MPAMDNRLPAALAAALALAVLVQAADVTQESPRAMPDVRFMTLEPGHFHAGLVQKEMYPGVSPRVHVFAPLGPELLDHLARIASFNRRTDKPTAWELDVHTDGDPLARMLRDRPGNVVILSGRNGRKIDRITASVGAGLHVLADKPWILKSADFGLLESALQEADARGLVAYDIMTERFEVTNALQRALVTDRAVFGEIVRGTPAEPGVYMESVHHLKKVVGGAPNIRPPWFFDTAEQGEGLNDVGTHLVDLVQWTLFPEQPIDYRADVEVLSAQRWPTMIPEAEFRKVTNAPSFPPALSVAVKDGTLEYFCNTFVTYTLRGVNTTLNVIWDWEAPAGGGDTHFATYRGTKSRIEVRQTRADGFRPEIYIVPAAGAKADVLAAVQARLQALAADYPGVTAEDRGSDLRLGVPDGLRLGHEAHFARVTGKFLGYVRDRRTMPSWERPNMLAKYWVSTKGTELSRRGAARPARRIAPS